MITATLYARRGRRGGEREPLPTFALDHNTLGTPLVDLAELYLLNLVARVEALDNLGHSPPFEPLPFFSLSQEVAAN
jgi:hypothetical protein